MDEKDKEGGRIRGKGGEGEDTVSRLSKHQLLGQGDLCASSKTLGHFKEGTSFINTSASHFRILGLFTAQTLSLPHSDEALEEELDCSQQLSLRDV